MKHYNNRDIMVLDEIGNYYSNHIAAMTTENLNSKTDIAAELAHRDLIIDQLHAEVRRLRDALAYGKALCMEHDAEVIERFLFTEAPRIDDGGPNPIDPQMHHCEWTLQQERERLHAAARQLRQQAKDNST